MDFQKHGIRTENQVKMENIPQIVSQRGEKFRNADSEAVRNEVIAGRCDSIRAGSLGILLGEAYSRPLIYDLSARI
jgi:hypothetical protein